jgi:hypothetical protein
MARRHKMQPYIFVFFFKWLAVVGVFLLCLIYFK